VPNENILGVSVTGSKKISYHHFASDLAPPVRQAVLTRKRAGMQSILRLV